MAAINRYPLWKYGLILFVILAAFIYAAPNLYPDIPAVQVMGTTTTKVDEATLNQVKNALREANIPYQNAQIQDQKRKQEKFD